MHNEIIINVEAGETRVALLERSVFSELHIERERGKSVVGNVVKGRVSRVLPGMQAAFVDIGLEKAAFLYVGDYFANPAGAENGDGPSPQRRRRNGRGQPPKIESVLKEGQEIVVQIAKAPIGTKGARITSNISIPGRHLVLTPSSRRVGVSRRIDSDRERKRLREIIDRLRPKDLGFIIRTAGDGVREADLAADIRYLATIWERIQLRNAETMAPAILHSEHDLTLRIIRDLANQDTKRIVVDSKEVFESISQFVNEFVADPKPQIEHYDGAKPIFDELGLEPQIHANLEKKVWLKSGGSLVVDQSEALTAIDVNTGRFVGKRDLEETVFKTNLEAVKEVVNQLRFRNIGGLIIIDLIDMDSPDHRDKVYRALQEAIRTDKARTNILKISELGLVEMTRKRTQENLVQTLCEPCSYCEGRGYVLSGETVAYNILRELRMDLPRICGRRIAITVSPRVAEQLLAGDSQPLKVLEEQFGREIEIRARPGLHQEQFEIEALDEGEPIEIALQWLRGPAEIAAEEAARAKQRTEARRNGRDAEAAEANPEEAEIDPGADEGEDGGAVSARRKRRPRRRGRRGASAPSEGEEDAEPSIESGSDDAEPMAEAEPVAAVAPGESVSPAIAAGPPEPIELAALAGTVDPDATSPEVAPVPSEPEVRLDPEGIEPVEAAPALGAFPQPVDDATQSRILPRSHEYDDPHDEQAEVEEKDEEESCTR